MVKYRTLDGTFGALADSTRRGIVLALSRGESSVTELTKPYSISAPAISKHLKVLERANLIIRRKFGKKHIFELNPPTFADASEYINYYTNFWESNLDSLKSYLERNDNGRTKC